MDGDHEVSVDYFQETEMSSLTAVGIVVTDEMDSDCEESLDHPQEMEVSFPATVKIDTSEAEMVGPPNQNSNNHTKVCCQ